MNIEEAVLEYKNTPNNKTFRIVFDMAKSIFDKWVRKIKRKVDINQAFSEFQFLLLRVVKKYNQALAKKWNGFECYLKASLRKLGITLWRKKENISYLPEKFDAPDPRSEYGSRLIDINDHIVKMPNDSRKFISLRAMGFSKKEIMSTIDVSDFNYRKIHKSIKNDQGFLLALNA